MLFELKKFYTEKGSKILNKNNGKVWESIVFNIRIKSEESDFSWIFSSNRLMAFLMTNIENLRQKIWSNIREVLNIIYEYQKVFSYFYVKSVFEPTLKQKII